MLKHVLWILVCMLPWEAQAFQIRDRLHADCHERLTAKSLSEAGYLRPEEAAAPLSEEDRRFIDDGEVDLSAYPRNLAAMALITGVRWNDLQGNGTFEMDHLATVHNADDDQRAHCLRRRGQDGVEGDRAALVDCVGFIREQLDAAFASIDSSGLPDSAREQVRIHAPYENTIEYPLPRFYFHAGRALHTVQDSFTHDLRSADWHQVINVGNWVEQVRGDLQEPRDGHPHERELDVCGSSRPGEAALVAAAQLASNELFQILVARDPHDATRGLSAADRNQALDAFFNRWFQYQGGCTLETEYCDNASYKELVHGTPPHGPWSKDLIGSGCSHASTGSLAGLALLGLLLRRRKAAMVALGLLVLVPTPARADEALTPGNHLVLRGSFSPDNVAFAWGVGVQHVFSRWDVGAIAEWNGPWFDWDAAGKNSLDLGAANAYAQLGWRMPLGPTTAMRFSASAGLTMLLFEKVSTRVGQINPYVGIGLGEVIFARDEGRDLSVCFADFALPVTQLRGWPFFYPQWRSTLTYRF
jgi:hypothetical protein